MNVTANIVCYKSKTLANGEHPLMVRICKDGKKKYKSLGVSVNPKHWNFERNTLKPNCPNYEYLSSLLSFNKHLDICFSDIDVCFLRRYETWLRKHGLAEDIDRILAYTSTNRYMRFPIDIFAFTYYCGGINFIDIANLTPANIIERKLVYKRHKTSKLIKIPLQPQAIELIKKYHRKDSPYLFPILSDFHQTEIQKSNRIHKVIFKVNQRLKEIGEDLGLPLTLTTYVARHSQATVMKRAGVSTAVIREIMGHSSERVTQIYLDSFDNEQIDNAMKHLL